jgi:multiple sugar transport system permease protein
MKINDKYTYLRLLGYYLLVGYGAITLIPFLWALSASFKPLSEIVSGATSWIPKHFTLDNYRQIFINEPLFSRWLLNTILRTELGGNETISAHSVVGGVGFNQSWVKVKL